MGEGDNGERRGRVKSRNMYKGPTDKDDSGGWGTGLNVGEGVEAGQWRVMVKKGDNCN